MRFKVHFHMQDIMTLILAFQLLEEGSNQCLGLAEDLHSSHAERNNSENQMNLDYPDLARGASHKTSIVSLESSFNSCEGMYIWRSYGPPSLSSK